METQSELIAEITPRSGPTRSILDPAIGEVIGEAPETVVDDGTTHAEIRCRPIGVVGAIGPWNWPMMIAVWQIAPALRMASRD